MIETDTDKHYKEPDPSFILPISDVDRDFVNVVVDKIVSVSDVHFIYFKSADAHVKINLGSIAYTGDLKPEVMQGAVAVYAVNGERVDFDGWALVRDKDYKWVFKENLYRTVVKEELPEPVVEHKPEPKKTKVKPKEVGIKPKELYEIFNFYLESFILLCHEDDSKVPDCKSLNNVVRNEEKYRNLRRLLVAVQTILEKEDYKRDLKPAVIRTNLIENGIVTIRDGSRFVRKMVSAWDHDRVAKLINKKGSFLYVIDSSAILDVDWMDVVPSTEPTVFKRIERLIKNRKCDMSLEDFNDVRSMRRENVRGRNSKTL